MPRASILGRFEREAIPARVPPDFRGLVRIATRPDVVYTVVLFPHDRLHQGVTSSALARRMLKRVPPEETVLAVGVDFTIEATALLNERGAAIARIGEFGWTDASHAGVR